MIQRIQSLYMLITAILMGIAAFAPLATIDINGEATELMASELIYMEVLVVLAALLPFIMIWLYKRLLLQLRLCFVEITLLVGSQAFFIIYLIKVFKGVREMIGDSYSDIALPVVFPTIGIIFMVLSIKAIARDFRKINSLNRIR